MKLLTANKETKKYGLQGVWEVSVLRKNASNPHHFLRSFASDLPMPQLRKALTDLVLVFPVAYDL